MKYKEVLETIILWLIIGFCFFVVLPFGFALLLKMGNIMAELFKLQ